MGPGVLQKHIIKCRSAGNNRCFFSFNRFEQRFRLEFADDNTGPTEGNLNGKVIIQCGGVIKRPDNNSSFAGLVLSGPDGIEKIPKNIPMSERCAFGLAGGPGSVHKLARIVFADLGCSASDVRLSSGKEVFIINCQGGLGILR